MEPSTAFVALDHERAGMVALLTDAIQSRVIGIPAFPLVLRSHRSWRDTRKHWKLLIKMPFSGTRRRRSTRRSCRRSCRRRRRTTRTNNKATPTEMRHLDPRSPTRLYRCVRPMLPLVTRSIASTAAIESRDRSIAKLCECEASSSSTFFFQVSLT